MTPAGTGRTGAPRYGSAPMEVFRTPDERFSDLPGYPYEPRYREWEGMRLAHVDEGGGPPVVMIHGEPTWGFLYRKLMPPLLEAGLPLRGAGPARLRPLGQAGRRRLVLVREPHAGDRLAARGARHRRRHVRHAGLGRPDRAARRHPRGPRAGWAARGHGHRRLHRPPADERWLAALPRLRGAQPRPPDQAADRRRVQAGASAGGGRRVRGAVPERGVQGGRTDLSADDPPRARLPGRRRGAGRGRRRSCARPARRCCSGRTRTPPCRSTRSAGWCSRSSPPPTS